MSVIAESKMLIVVPEKPMQFPRLRELERRQWRWLGIESSLGLLPGMEFV
jgi:hypothetical protein